MEKTIKFYNKNLVEVKEIENCDCAIVTTKGTVEELKLLFPELFGIRVWIDGVLGCVGFDISGYRIYEDVVHDIGNGNFQYYIQENLVDGYYIVPEREDIPRHLQNKEVTSRWIQFRKDDKLKEGTGE